MRCMDSTSGTGIGCVGENELDNRVGNPVPFESQDSDAAAGPDGSQPWSDWIETQDTPCANCTANWAAGVSAEELVIPPRLNLGSPNNSGQAAQSQPQTTPTFASECPETDSDSQNKQALSASQAGQHDLQVTLSSSAQSAGTDLTSQNNQPSASSPGATSGTDSAACRNLVPNMHRGSGRQSAVSSVSSAQSSLVQSLLSAPTGKSSGLTAAYEATSMKKLTVMQSQLDLDTKQYELEVQDWLEAKAERRAKRKDLKQERAHDCADRAAERREMKEERNQERAEQKAIRDFQEKERQDRIKVANEWLKQGTSASDIQLKIQATFGSL
ncbi:hypothetical protein PCASD_23538 [Puccinia coronata f. sp. avenae]|uniref:Uncharacterized protein n=1 Tax=Puccinia coronata f. sp. avenae TaxID=200324 RepID=A0A2N5TKY0_9BASI|nr:hypothetical protein PCASD_23538 [Puccinia coronata f. sp. avenae]